MKKLLYLAKIVNFELSVIRQGCSLRPISVVKSRSRERSSVLSRGRGIFFSLTSFCIV